MIQNNLQRILVLLVTLALLVNTAAATCNIVIITDPTGTDPNGAAAGSMSFAENMFQSTFIMSKEKHFTVLSGGEGNSTPRLAAIVETINRLNNGATASEAASAASSYSGIRVMTGGPTIGAAVGGSFDAYVVTVAGDGTITATPVSSGLATLPAGQKGAIIHLRNTHGNPLYGTAETVRQDTAIMIGKMIRDGYPATEILGAAFENVAVKSGEKYGGGGNNLVSSITTGDMFTPSKLNTTGYPMDEPYAKECPTDGWSVAYPAAENYQTCPYDGTPLKTVYAYDALKDKITVTSNSTTVSVYGTDAAGVSETTDEIVTYSVKKNGYNSATIATAINNAIDNGLLVGVNYIEPKDINIVESTRSVGVYFKPLPDGRTSPPWNLPISTSILDIVGSIQTAIGLILIILVLFRSTLISSFLKKRR
ncbi:hypothetical protein [Methanobacterium sp.]|uniref:hypothetical protein n=1 Tax=Methanobacterium sp. TaxID=2164 RepID=UPI0025FA3348|nr:hypothetical protein [Methanobacterium sp.]MBI5458583.1 hypothetical protein [Methanobacterium sp.]